MSQAFPSIQALRVTADAHRTFARNTRVDQGGVAENNWFSEAVEMCRAMQAELPPKLRRHKVPARTAQLEHILACGYDVSFLQRSARTESCRPPAILCALVVG
jgi:hypothetical protein